MADHKDTGDDLKKVIKEAEGLLEQLDQGKQEASYSSATPESWSTLEQAKVEPARINSVSKEMQARLKAIDGLVSQGYQVKKVWDAFPVLVSSSGINKSVLVATQAGFSWIAFFFPFAVCTQIREWSYFFVIGSTYLVGSILYKFSGFDPGFVIGIAISVQYAFYFPYLRWLALQRKKTEVKTGTSIILGLLLNAASVAPSLIYEALFIGT